MTDAELMMDRSYVALAKKAAKAAEARSKLPPGSTRARVTSANARWARAAEARDARARYLHEQWETSIGGSSLTDRGES